MWYNTRGHYAERRFPFWTFRAMGWTLMLLGLVSFVLGLADTCYTATKFEGDDCDTVEFLEDGWSETPCGHDDHVFTYVSAAIWGSLLVIITGIIGARFSKWNTRHLRFQRDLFAVMAGVTATLFIPVMIAMHALELKFAKDMGAFYYNDNDLKTRDEVKFSLPIVILIVAGVEWIICVIIFTICCCCAPVDEESGVPMRLHSPVIRPVSSSISGYHTPAYTLPMTTAPRPVIMPVPTRPASVPMVAQPSISPMMLYPNVSNSAVTAGYYGATAAPSFVPSVTPHVAPRVLVRRPGRPGRTGQTASLATSHGRPPPGSVMLPPVAGPPAMDAPYGRALYMGTLYNDYETDNHGLFVPKTEEFLTDDTYIY